MRGRAGAYRFVLRRLLVASGITGHGIGHAPDVLIHALHAPKTPAGKDGDLECRIMRFIDRGCGMARPSLAADGNARADACECQQCNDEENRPNVTL